MFFVMKNCFLLLLIVAFIVSCEAPSSQQPATTEVPEYDYATMFENVVNSTLQETPNCKGIIMHVEAPDQQISWTGAAGWADSATQRKLKSQDPVVIASMTKTYVAAAILRLQEMGLLELDQSIGSLLSKPTVAALQQAGYDVEAITVAQLCSHTSGITDYVAQDAYQNATLTDEGHEWTRDEQIALALSVGPKGLPAQLFSYSDTNYLLLTEIMEQLTHSTFYEAMRELLQFDKYQINHTWFIQLEETPKGLSNFPRQYATSFQVESYRLHPTFDLYGGGGLAATAEDAAHFSQLLFTGALFEKAETKELLWHTVPTTEPKENEYYMGVALTELDSFKAYGHGGFWGTTSQYFPELNASVSIFLMERDEWPRYRDMLLEVAQILSNSPHKPE